MSRVIFLLFLLGWAITSADEVEGETPDSYRHSNRNGIILMWNGSWNLGAGSTEGGIGYKRWISEKLTIRTIIAIAKTETTIIYDDFYPERRTRIRERKFSALIGVEDHLWSRDRLSFFIAGAFQFRFLRSKIDQDESRFPVLSLKDDSNTYSLQGSVGLEYFVFRSLSLQVGYQVDVSRIEAPGRKTWNLGVSTTSLTVTFYP
jgi:hypothetical protein